MKIESELHAHHFSISRGHVEAAIRALRDFDSQHVCEETSYDAASEIDSSSRTGSAESVRLFFSEAL